MVGAGEILVIGLICLVTAVVPVVLVLVVVKLVKKTNEYSTPQGRLEAAATLLPWSPQAFTDVAAELDADWSRGPGGTHLSGRARSLSQKDAAWLIFYVQRDWSGNGTISARSSAGELVLQVSAETVQAWMDGVPLGQLLRRTGALHAPLSEWGALVERPPVRELVHGGVTVARIARRRAGKPSTPLVQLDGPLPAEAMPWLLFAMVLELGWRGAEPSVAPAAAAGRA